MTIIIIIIIICQGSSGIAQICVQEKDGDNNIVLVPGANGRISEKLCTYFSQFLKSQCTKWPNFYILIR